MRILLFLIILSISAQAKTVKPGPYDRFKIVKDTFSMALNVMWPSFEDPAFFCGQIEQESNWKSRAELKTHREYGFGYGQFTLTYDAAGKVKMNVWQEMRDKYPKLFAGWSWENRFDSRFQIMALLQLNRTNYIALGNYGPVGSDSRKFAMARAYNGGLGGVNKDMRFCLGKGVPLSDCQFKAGVDPNLSTKSKKPFGPGYGAQSAYSINSSYASLIEGRKVKYLKDFPRK